MSIVEDTPQLDTPQLDTPWQAPPALTAGWSTARGHRTITADVAAVRCGGQGFAAALADGTSDSVDAAHAAVVASAMAVEAAMRSGALDAVHAANTALRDLRRSGEAVGDCVLAVAAGTAQRWAVAWVGDCRAYVVVDGTVARLTTDHTVAEYLRSHGVAAGERLEHVVTSTVAEPAEIGCVAGPKRWDSIVLLTDGVHNALDEHAIPDALRDRDAVTAARELTRAALSAGSRDNVGAVVVSR